MGDGKERKSLEKLAKKFKIEKKVTFTGKVKREEVIEKLKASDLFILLSNNETFGLTYLEAMATRNIVIAKENDGIDGIINHEQNGFLTKATPLELKKCLEKILLMSNSEIEQIRANSIETIKGISMEEAAKNYLKNIQ